MDTKQLQGYLSQEWPGTESFIENIIKPIFGADRYKRAGDDELLDREGLKKIANSSGVTSVIRNGIIKIPGNPLDVYTITVNDRKVLERNRVGVQALVRRIMNLGENYQGAFMLFHYADGSNADWRFSFCQKYQRYNLTDAKRFTFLLGPNQACKTAAQNFAKLSDVPAGTIRIENIVNAFSVESLSKEFFKKYKEIYEDIVEYITGKRYIKKGDKYVETIINKTPKGIDIYEAFDKDDKLVRDYIKKLLGRIVFLHFVQKKGWLGVPQGGKWGEGDQSFMLNLWQKANASQQEDFLDSVLEPLFSGALDTDRRKNGDLFNTKVKGIGTVRIPYLNSGLFLRDDLDKKTVKLPAEHFNDFFTMLSEYNFTVDENDPNDTHVGVDPEMLGRIFENLLEDNKDKGAYYTPKEIVHYMCQESLIAYLQNDEKNGDKEAIASFVYAHDKEALVDKGGAALAKRLDQKLKDVKICDPAIGSGAFPMGLLRELFYCRDALEEISTHGEQSKIKKEILLNNIYGVDIERGAVEIARLRFWLALVVDEETPETLPNLDYKIMQGNSLLEEYAGISLNMDSKDGTLFGERDKIRLKQQIHSTIQKYYSVTDHDEKEQLNKELTEAIQDYLTAGAAKDDATSFQKRMFKVLEMKIPNDKFFLWHIFFGEVFDRQDGFNIIIGNPPYGAALDEKDKEALQNIYKTAKTIKGIQKGSLDSFTLFLELGYNLLHTNGNLAFIVPIAFTSSDSLAGMHKLLKDNCDTIKVSSYAARPQPVFENAMVDTSIVQFTKTLTPCAKLLSTKMNRKGSGFNLAKLINDLQFIDVKTLCIKGRIPKVGQSIEVSILKKVSNFDKLTHYFDKKGSPIYYRYSGGRYFKVITPYTNKTSSERELLFNKKYRDAIGCILSSNLSFWFYQIYSDNYNWRTNELYSFTIPNLESIHIKTLSEIYSEYLKEIESNCIRKQSKGSTYKVSSFKEYHIVKSKHIIDRIDDFIGPLYGLTDKEIDFIKSYELQFRMAGDSD